MIRCLVGWPDVGWFNWTTKLQRSFVSCHCKRFKSLLAAAELLSRQSPSSRCHFYFVFRWNKKEKSHLFTCQLVTATFWLTLLRIPPPLLVKLLIHKFVMVFIAMRRNSATNTTEQQAIFTGDTCQQQSLGTDEAVEVATEKIPVLVIRIKG